jgi:hypothetical protein
MSILQEHITVIKEAHDTLSAISGEFEHYKQAHELAVDFLQHGRITAEAFDQTFKSFLNRSQDDLRTMEKAAELITTGQFSFGELSDNPRVPSRFDNFTNMLLTED